MTHKLSFHPEKDVFDPQFHMFWSTNDGGVMWEPEDNCPRGPGGDWNPKESFDWLI